MRWSRRQFIGWTGAGAALGASAGLAGVQPRRRDVVDFAEGKTPRFVEPISVVIAGGGLAGMSAALELAERGAQVTLLEAAPHLGGRLGGWPIRVGAEPYRMEHGFHGFFAQYYNLNNVITRLGLDSEFTEAVSYPLLFRSGQPENFLPGSWGFPFELARFALGSNNLAPLALANSTDEMHALLAFDGQLTFERYDDESFADFCRRGIDPDVYTFFFGPFAKTTLNSPETVSAAYVLSFFHFYFLGNPEGMSFRQTKQDCMTSLILPWKTRLQQLGVRVVTEESVLHLLTHGDKVTGVRTGASTETALLDASLDLAAGPGAGLPQQVAKMASGVPVFAVTDGGATEFFVGRCTHQGCSLLPHEDGFLCPCHGGKFDRQGEVLSGPPKRPLSRLRVLGRELSRESVSTDYQADHVVLALDVGGTQAVVGASEVSIETAQTVASLREAEPYLVVRLWFEERRAAPGPGFYTTGQYQLLDSIGIYEHLQEESHAWAERHNGSIVELHSYAISAELDRGVLNNAQLLIDEFLECMPEYAQARIVHRELLQQSNFSGFSKGSHRHRPRTVSGTKGLWFSGDWVRLDEPVALMEAAVTSGRLAANAILRQHSVREAAYSTVPLTGVLPPKPPNS